MSYEDQEAMQLSIRYIPSDIDRWDLKVKLARILHDEPFRQPRPDRKMNFDVFLYLGDGTEGRHNGSGKLTVPTEKIARQFLNYIRTNPVKYSGKKIKFSLLGPPNDKNSQKIAAMVQKAPFVDPHMERDREERVFELEETLLRVVKVQFGVLFRTDPKEPRKYSIEWEHTYTDEVGYLKFEFDHKLIRVQLTNPVSGHTGTDIVINFASISRIAVGEEYINSYIIFDTTTPPSFEEFDLHRPMTGRKYDDSKDNPRYKRRIGSVNRIAGHARVAPFAHTLRLLVRSYDSSDVVKSFRRLCKVAELQTIIWPPLNRPVNNPDIEAAGYAIFSEKSLHRWSTYTSQHDWPVAFQLEGLLHNCLLNVQELLKMTHRFDSLCEQHGTRYVAVLLQRYAELLSNPSRPPETPEQTLSRLLSRFVFKDKTIPRTFQCYHVIVTPTRTILEGPYPTDSNRIIRQYAGFEDYFIRVAFCDEDRMRLRWSRVLNAFDFLQDRIGTILKEGFTLAGRHFEFLAYSTSALREHSVWFMNPFQHPSLGRVTSQNIRDSIGDFGVLEDTSEDAQRDALEATPEDTSLAEGKPPLLWCPSKYAARLAQAFTATESSVRIHRREWEIMPDLGNEPYLFTDGVGTVSEGLGDEIWEALCKSRPNRIDSAIKPSAYQIRFLGFKGVVAVDKELDKIPGSSIRMRLRPSMHKFENSTNEAADIEIALAFEAPMPCYFNRALVMILEDRGVQRSAFLDLLRLAVADAQLVDNSLTDCHKFLASHSFGNAFRLSWVLEQLLNRGAEITLSSRTYIDSEFLKELRRVARMQTLKEIKHDARIPIPDSFLLAGVADEGPAYVDDPNKPAYSNTYCLPENNIYACIQRPGDEKPTWIEGACLIWRSPLTHPGDVQNVNAIGKPPPNCLFGHLINVVVLPSRGWRSLASCLGGGDLDGDTFTVCTCTSILPTLNVKPAQYPPGEDLSIGRNSTVEDICNFIIEYFNSDVLGLVSDRLLVIADQSEKGIFDRQCEDLATLCSQAVDYPKKGQRVDISGDRLPRPLIRPNPDWHAAEVVNPRKSDYYDSTRALGFMYREITLPQAPKDPLVGLPKPMIFETESITSLLRDCILCYLPLGSFDKSRRDKDVEDLFQNYVDNLRYISAIHTLSNDSTIRLKEEEIVLGVILANCQERRWRRERMYKMRLHTLNLVKEIKQGFQPSDRVEEEVTDREGLLHILDKAWYAWVSAREQDFGTNSFRLIALGSVLDCIEKLEKLPVETM